MPTLGPPRTRRFYGVWPLACCIALFFMSPSARADEDDTDEGNPGPLRMTEKHSLGPLTVKIFASTKSRGGMFRVLQNGRQVAGDAYESGSDFTMGNFGGNEHPPVGLRPLLNDGRPSFVVKQFTGGIHCCVILHVFVTKPRVERVAVVDAQDSSFADFEFHQGRWVLHMNDWTFRYWKADFASSPAPDIRLVWKDGKFRLDRTILPRRLPSVADLAKRVRAEDWTRKTPPPALWGNMLDYIYAGHASDALQLFGLAWPGERGGKQEFLEEFYRELQTSPYWLEIRKWDSEAQWP